MTSKATGGDRVPGDEVLVARARAGDEAAFEAIVQRYAPTVERLVRRFFGPGPDHPDLCQEVFLRLFRRLSELKRDDALRGFVFTLALGVSRNELRRLRLRRLLGLERGDAGIDEHAAPGSDIEAREAVHHLYDHLGELGAEDRSLFIARFVEKLELAEVAVVHGLSYGTAKRRVARLTEKLSRRMRRDPALAQYVAEWSR